ALEVADRALLQGPYAADARSVVAPEGVHQRDRGIAGEDALVDAAVDPGVLAAAVPAHYLLDDLVRSSRRHCSPPDSHACPPTVPAAPGSGSEPLSGRGARADAPAAATRS